MEEVERISRYVPRASKVRGEEDAPRFFDDFLFPMLATPFFFDERGYPVPYDEMNFLQRSRETKSRDFNEPLTPNEILSRVKLPAIDLSIYPFVTFSKFLVFFTDCSPETRKRPMKEDTDVSREIPVLSRDCVAKPRKVHLRAACTRPFELLIDI